MARQRGSNQFISTIEEETDTEETVKQPTKRVTISNKIEVIPGKKNRIKSAFFERKKRFKDRSPKRQGEPKLTTVSDKDKDCSKRSGLSRTSQNESVDKHCALDTNIRVIELDSRKKIETIDCATQTIESSIREDSAKDSVYNVSKDKPIAAPNTNKSATATCKSSQKEGCVTLRHPNDVVAQQPEILFLLQEIESEKLHPRDSRFKTIVQTLPERIATRPWVAVDAKKAKETWIQLLDTKPDHQGHNKSMIPKALRRIQSATVRKSTDEPASLVRVQSARLVSGPCTPRDGGGRGQLSSARSSPRSFVLVSKLAQQMAMRSKTAQGRPTSSVLPTSSNPINGLLQSPGYVMTRPPQPPQPRRPSSNRPKSAPQKLHIFKGHPGVQALSHVRPDCDAPNDASNTIHKEYNPKMQKISLQMTDFRKPNSIIKLNLSYASSSLEGDGARIISEDIKRFHQKKEKMISHGIKTIERRLENQKKAREERKIRLQQEELRKKREEEERQQGRKYNTSRFFSTDKDVKAGDESHLTFSEKRAERQKRIDQRTSLMAQQGQRLKQVTKAKLVG